jgi:hypothetical protein
MIGKLTAEKLTAFFTAIIAITGVLALAYAHWQLREAHEEAQIQHLMAFDQQYRQEPMTRRAGCLYTIRDRAAAG